MPSELTRQRILARMSGGFTSPDGRWEFPTSGFRRAIDEAVTTQLVDRGYRLEPQNPLTARDDGSVAAIDVASFVVHWPDIPGVAYQAATIGNLGFSTQYAVYFDDATRDGKRDTCFFVTQSGIEMLESPNRIFLGVITTPADGGGDVTTPDTPGGGGYGGGGGDGIARLPFND